MEIDGQIYWTCSRRRRLTIFAIICFSYFCYGQFVGTLGQEFSSLLTQMNTSETKLGYANSVRSISYGCFSLLATFTIERISRHVHFIASQALLCFALVIMSHLTKIYQYWTLCIVTGMGMAFSDCSSNMWIFELFPENVNFYLQLLYFFFAVGQTLGPLVIMISSHYLTEPIFGLPSSVVAPFYLNAILYFIAFLLVTGIYLIKPYVPPKRSIDGKDKKTLAEQPLKQDQHLSVSEITINQYCSGTLDSDKPKQLIDSPKSLPKIYYVYFVAIANVVISLNSTNETATINFLPYFLRKSGIAVNEQEQNEMGIVNGFAYAIGHLLMMVGALRFSNTGLVYLSLVQVMLANVFLCFPQAHALLHWVAVVFLCFGFSTAFPSLLSFIESRINITNSINCLFLATFSFLSAFYSMFIGDMFQEGSYQIVGLSLSFTILIMFSFLHLFDRWRKNLLARQ